MRYLILIATLALALPAQAADICASGGATTPVCVTTTADQNTAGTFLRREHNAKLCVSVGLAKDCTQAAFDAAGGVGTVYANSAQGTVNYFSDVWVTALLSRLQGEAATLLRERLKASQAGGDVTALLAACTNLGLDADCE